MTLFILAFLAGALTILAPCILPVIPFVFARADRPFLTSGLPLLAGMAVSFAGVATLATLGGAWAAEANDLGRGVAIAVLALMGLALLVPRWAERWTRPLVALGARLGAVAERVEGRSRSRAVLASAGLGAATGLLWAPCAGPVLGLVLTTAALQGASVHTSLLLLAYAAGAATSLGLALWAGSRVFALMKRGLGATEWLRRGLGAAVLAGVAVIALGWDTQLLARLVPAGSSAFELSLLERFVDRPAAARGSAPVKTAATPDVKAMPIVLATAPAPTPAAAPLPFEGKLPGFAGGTGWLNSAPLTAEGLRGKVVLVDVWTFACINCIHTLPHVRAWYDKYKDQGLVVVGVHSPEFAFERKTENVKRAAGELGVTFPIVLDNDFAIWRSLSNQFWPALYFVDAQGNIRHHHFGEGDYERSEQVIRQLLDEAKAQPAPRV